MRRAVAAYGDIVGDDALVALARIRVDVALGVDPDAIAVQSHASTRPNSVTQNKCADVKRPCLRQVEEAKYDSQAPRRTYLAARARDVRGQTAADSNADADH